MVMEDLAIRGNNNTCVMIVPLPNKVDDHAGFLEQIKLLRKTKQLKPILKNLLTFLFVLLFLPACRTSKKAFTETPKTPDTLKVAHTDSLTLADSLRWAKTAFENARSGMPIFQTFHAKIKIDYESKSQSFQGILNLRVQKDSIIWLSATGPLGIEAMRAIIKPDSVIIMDKFEKSVIKRPVSFLQNQLNIPVDFFILQDIIIGNVFFADTAFSAFQISKDTIELTMPDKGFQNIIHLNRTNNRVIDNTLFDKNPFSNRVALFTFLEYVSTNGIDFPMFRKIKITDTLSKDIELTFKQIDFDQPQTFPFNIPNYYFIK